MLGWFERSISVQRTRLICAECEEDHEAAESVEFKMGLRITTWNGESSGNSTGTFV